MSPVHCLKKQHLLPVSLEEAWNFFANPANLSRLTPLHLNLKFTNELFGDTLYPGQIITYRVRPVAGIPVFWMTEITHVDRMKFFVDEQRKGPYALWHHQHHFKSIAGGVEMTDIIHYRIPFGPLGELGLPFIKKQLHQIFSYHGRYRTLSIEGIHKPAVSKSVDEHRDHGRNLFGPDRRI